MGEDVWTIGGGGDVAPRIMTITKVKTGLTGQSRCLQSTLAIKGQKKLGRESSVNNDVDEVSLSPIRGVADQLFLANYKSLQAFFLYI